MNASGALCVTREELEALGRSRAGAIVTKSMTLESRAGNPEPRYYPFGGGSINSMGLPNLGYRAYAELIPALKAFGKPVIASVAGLGEDDFPEIARVISRAGPDLVEVNLSCPNIPGKPQIGYDFEASERLIRRVRAVVTQPMGVKLPPYFDPAHHAAMAEVLKRAPVDFLSLINSVGNALVIDPERESVVIKPKGGFGGLGGAIIKPVALANVRAFWKAFEGRIPIIGVGGVTHGLDAFEHLLAGASAVQVGTALVEEGTGVFDRIAAELRAVLEKKGYPSAAAAVGRLKEL
jgi:dihydroorotate dehydrogenase (fumarate)